MAGRNKKEISKGLLQMKFMQRSQLKKDADNKHSLNSTNVPSTSSQTIGGKYVYEPRYEVLEGLVYGRMSFQGFNPEVEKLMAYYQSLSEDVGESQDADVTAEEYAKSHSSMSKTVAKLFGSKRKRKEDIKVEEDEEEDEEEGEIIEESVSPPKKKKFRKPS